ncbi:hypothetical protein SAMN04489724_0658 [Algoriphagus locisalis]|uniref:SGNH/GDSL hydrolase family protein n=2 Tax=Algoriphagus locisalis TaxID=305507 RepID=A0A1I6XUU5_9BACT|nr:hypothetical protein SAMN04489724_0658 [Algoriphagus locisalis]
MSIFSILPLASLYLIFLLENGTADPFYQRFVTPKQKALILGNSKAAQGIIPSIIIEQLADVYQANLYNYSFTVYNSPFGPAYLESVKNKLAEYDGKRYFIITVDPWSISSDINDPNNLDKFEENDRFISDINDVSSNPNVPYLLKWFSKSYYEIILMRSKNNLSKLNEDGWFMTGENVSKNVMDHQRKLMVDYYTDYLNKYSLSELRLKYLKETIGFLKERGDVYLVRMPLHTDILKIEEQVVIDFDQKIHELSNLFDVPFFDYSKSVNVFEFKDGLHLDKKSAENFSNQLVERISRFEELKN